MTTPAATDTQPWKASRWRMRYYRLRYYVTETWGFRVGTARLFLRLAWKGFRGKLCVMDTHNTQVNGGYRYKTLVISKLPVSADHTYEDL